MGLSQAKTRSPSRSARGTQVLEPSPAPRVYISKNLKFWAKSEYTHTHVSTYTHTLILREIFHMMLHSLSGHKGWYWPRPKSGRRLELLCLPHGQHRPSNLYLLSLFPKHYQGLNWKLVKQGLIWDGSITDGSFICQSTALFPRQRYLKTIYCICKNF